MDVIELKHGAGGRATGRLVRDLFRRHFANPCLDALDDGARLSLEGPCAFSTDAFVVDPLFFPGGDIGSLAAAGTLNDVAMCGAEPRALSAAFVLEEGLPIRDLEQIVQSLAATARAAGAEVVTGDTKVVPRGRADGCFITTSGLGPRLRGVDVAGRNARPGDRLLVSGPVGDHGAAIMAARAGLKGARSDCAAVSPVVVAFLRAITPVHALRDPTRGGLTAAVCEIAEASGVGIELHEASIPVSPATHSVAEVLGLDPLGLASEGRFIAFLPGALADRALEVLVGLGCREAACVGGVSDTHPGQVVLETAIGGRRLLAMSEGEPLPRIC